MKPSLFISDIHLSAEPQRNRLFCQFLEHVAPLVSCIYILGDWFDAYLGDDIEPDWLKGIEASCRAATQHHVTLYCMRGNHDFLIGQDFLRRAQLTFLADPSLIHIDQHRLLLSHGDRLCVFDKSHQRFRRFYSLPGISRLAMHLPLSWRQAIGNKLNDKPNAPKNTPQLKATIPDHAIEQLVTPYQCDIFIHGHIHVPLQETRQGTKKAYQRVVLPAWSDDTAHYVLIDQDSLTFQQFKLNA